MVSFSVARAVALASALPIVFVAAEAGACGGPCTSPLLWDVLQGEGGPLVVTNFGLLTEAEGTWNLVCEETIGGLLLEARTSGQRALVSTDLGLFAQGEDSCEWGPGPRSDRSDWLLTYTTIAPQGEMAIEHLALVYDAQAQVINLEASSGAEFSVLRSFDADTSYRQLAATAGLGEVFVAGYTAQGRAWRITYSLDGADTWQEATPPFDDSTLALYLRYVDPEFPDEPIVLAQSTRGDADQIWRFSSETGQLSPLLTLTEDSIVVGVTVVGEWLWVAGRSTQAGSLYRARRGSGTFERVEGEHPAYSCLSSIGTTLFACVDDFTADSPFVLGTSEDEGATWTPRMKVEDLGKLTSCGAECTPTLQWLEQAYAAPSDDAADAGAPSSPAGDEPSPSRNRGCNVTDAGGYSRQFAGWAWWSLIGAGVLVSVARFWRQRH